MSLLAEFLQIAQDWRKVFPQQRTFERALRQSLGSLVCLGRRAFPVSFGPTAASREAGAQSIFFTPVAAGIPSNCFSPSWNVVWRIVHSGW